MSDGPPGPAAPAAPATPGTPAVTDPTELLRSRSYVQLLLLAALIGVPISAIAYGYLALVGHLQNWVFTSVPLWLGFHGAPVWWPAPLLVVAGVLVSLTITYLPGTSGHEPAEGFHTGASPLPIELPGVILASLATLTFGVVLGPEAPLIAIGGGLGVLAVRLASKDAPPMAATVIAAAGSFAAISTLLGSPIVGAFLLMEASGIGGPLLGLVLVPGLLAAGVGTLIFIGLDRFTGLGTFSLAIPGLPTFSHPTGVLFLWALAIGVVASFVGTGIHLAALALQSVVVTRRLLWTPVAGLVVAAVAIAFAELTGKGVENVLFSGQNQLPGLVVHATAWTVGALVVLAVAKSLAYTVSLSGFRGGPIFPAMFVGATIGVAGSHLPGLSLVPAVAMGIGAMTTVMLRLPLTATLLAVLLFASDGLSVTPVVIVAVVVAYVASARLPQHPSELLHRAPSGEPAPAPAASGTAAGGVG
jgi:H+/Cl- antiporter ClcA